MNRSTWWILAAAALAPPAAPPAFGQDRPAEPRRVALSIGINQYQRRGFDALRWAENDAIALAAELRRLQFDKVVVMTGTAGDLLLPTRARILAQLDRLLADVTRNDVVLVALSGHGAQIDVRGPTAASATTPSSARSTRWPATHPRCSR